METLCDESKPLDVLIRNVSVAAIKKAPAVDAVEVVRCKDCRNCRNLPYGMCYLHTEPSTNFKGYKGDAVCVEADDYCSYGERKEAHDAET